MMTMNDEGTVYRMIGKPWTNRTMIKIVRKSAIKYLLDARSIHWIHNHDKNVVTYNLAKEPTQNVTTPVRLLSAPPREALGDWIPPSPSWRQRLVPFDIATPLESIVDRRDIAILP
mmetsp:Transcript_17363/g.35990  ORF Transcript_17363/g.35990 Transcript_17363/m.35990 type:complete len:116 (+) Transcript_17363:725-1072(+)